MYQKGRAWIELNMENLKHNTEQFRRLLPSDCALMPAVKANAYGHGALPVSRALQQQGVNSFCVASVSEGIELRRGGITGEILVLAYTHPGQFGDLITYGLTQTVVDGNYARELQRDGRRFTVHVGIDTGMHRLGERWENMDEIVKIFQTSNLNVTGLYSHLCVSDGQTQEERAYTLEQVQHFEFVVEELHRRGIHDFKCHLQGSYGILNYSELCFDYARAGIALYGILSEKSDKINASVELKPVLSLKTRVESVKMLYQGEGAGYGLTYRTGSNRKIGVLSIGYADGIPRTLSNCGYVLCNGRPAPVVGRICMDQMTVDLSEVPQVKAGDEAVLIGTSGNLEIRAEDLAHWTGTISNEILSRMGERLERVLE
ncbi:alanine racemase [Eubacterium sp. 14-2]|uniref:serine racemase VanT catalytic subunit n=1 Tax=Eubacterium sp. 14-2 TaxID=1235790 RepID=UPI00033B7DDD|nr:serine racemase VanT catalytic subunit [Eubacterium sp. 14-2]EOT24596.1 alanine racemase [Eubacterium sp. 14-2]